MISFMIFKTFLFSFMYHFNEKGSVFSLDDNKWFTTAHI